VSIVLGVDNGQKPLKLNVTCRHQDAFQLSLFHVIAFEIYECEALVCTQERPSETG
jgi:hypothetical protein